MSDTNAAAAPDAAQTPTPVAPDVSNEPEFDDAALEAAALGALAGKPAEPAPETGKPGEQPPAASGESDPAKPAPETGAPPPVEPPNPLAAAAPPARSPDDERFEQRFAELRAREQAVMMSEAERRQLAEIRARDEAERANPGLAFKRMGWTEKDITDFVLNGAQTPPPGAQMSDISRQIQELRQQNEQLQASIAEREAQRELASFKATIPAQVTEKTAPHVCALYENPADRAEAIWGIIHAVHRNENRVISITDATVALETLLSQQAAKLGRVGQTQRNQPEPVKPAAAPAITTRNTTSSLTPPEDIDPSDTAALDAAALKILQNGVKG